MPEITTDQLRMFFDSHADYYLTRWEYYQNGHLVTFKPYAFLFGIFWFLYRKMYFEALVIFLVTILEGALSQTFGLESNPQSSQATNVIFSLINASFLGFLGNYLYIRHTQRKIAGILQQNPTQTELETELQRQGGTSPVAVIMGLAAYLGLILLMIAGS